MRVCVRAHLVDALSLLELLLPRLGHSHHEFLRLLETLAQVRRRHALWKHTQRAA